MVIIQYVEYSELLILVNKDQKDCMNKKRNLWFDNVRKRKEINKTQKYRPSRVDKMIG